MLTEQIIVGCVTPILLAIFAFVQQNWRKKDKEDAIAYRKQREEMEHAAQMKQFERDKKIDLLCDGTRSLLRADIISIYSKGKERGYMNLDDVEYLEKVYNSYHALGGNGSGTKLYKEAMKLETRR